MTRGCCVRTSPDMAIRSRRRLKELSISLFSGDYARLARGWLRRHPSAGQGRRAAPDQRHLRDYGLGYCLRALLSHRRRLLLLVPEGLHGSGTTCGAVAFPCIRGVRSRLRADRVAPPCEPGRSLRVLTGRSGFGWVVRRSLAAVSTSTCFPGKRLVCSASNPG